MRRLVLAVLITIVPATTLSAQTLALRDILELTKAGLDEEVLLALIEVHRPVFPIDAATLKMLKDAGVRQSVIVAMVKSGRDLPDQPVVEPEPAIATVAPSPQVVVIEHEYPRADRQIREVVVPVAVPVYVPVRVRSIDRLHPIDGLNPIEHVRPARPVEPVYWGFGGKLRPDAWTPTEPPKSRSRPGDPQKK